MWSGLSEAREIVTRKKTGVVKESYPMSSGPGVVAGGDGAFGSVDKVRATLEAFDQILRSMSRTLRYMDVRVRSGFTAGRAHRDLSAAPVEQFDIQDQSAVRAVHAIAAPISTMRGLVTFLPRGLDA